MVLGIQPGFLCMPSRCSTTELYPEPSLNLLIVVTSQIQAYAQTHLNVYVKYVHCIYDTMLTNFHFFLILPIKLNSPKSSTYCIP